MRTAHLLVLALATLVLVALVGCGGNATPASTSSTPTPPTTPTTTPPTTPPTSGGGSAATAQWTSSVSGGTGTVTVFTSGDVTVQVTGATHSTSFRGNFCQFPGNDHNLQNQNPCFALNTT